jgi:hypothetical protein
MPSKRHDKSVVLRFLKKTLKRHQEFRSSGVQEFRGIPGTARNSGIPGTVY